MARATPRRLIRARKPYLRLSSGTWGGGSVAGVNYFPCYDNYLERLAKLSDQEVGRLFRALMWYNRTGETQELAGRESVAFDFIAVDIDRAKEAYKKKCETNRKNRQGALTPDNDR